MKFYNTMNRKIEEFIPQDPTNVKIYCCGPTVYDFAHLGNLRTFIFYDILRRSLVYAGFKVKQVMNITDVDDKMIKNSKKRGMALKEYAAMYTKYLFDDLRDLNISEFESYPRATESVDEMKTIIYGLLKKGYAYKSDDGIYYNVSKFEDYGKLSHASFKSNVARIKNDEYDKESAADFALWKDWTKEDENVFWEDGIQKGRPGWHIECSAMSIKHLGETLDIHSGGIDLIFPHHENEIAQSEAYTGKPFVRYWLHPGHLFVNEKKMSKSLHNFYTLRDLEKLGFDPLSFRLMTLDVHYRAVLDLHLDTLKKYEKTLEDIDITMKSFDKLERGDYSSDKDSLKSAKIALNGFKDAVLEDLNLPLAMTQLFRLIDIINKKVAEGKINQSDYEELRNAVFEMDSVLGIIKSYNVPQEIITLANERKELRDKKAWMEADKKRTIINDAGFKIIDLANSNYIIIKNRKYGR